MIGYMVLTALLAAAVTGLLFMGRELRDTRRALDYCAALRGDSDLDRHNNGVTLAVL